MGAFFLRSGNGQRLELRLRGAMVDYLYLPDSEITQPQHKQGSSPKNQRVFLNKEGNNPDPYNPDDEV
ncbi:hypothetical protein GCM10023187_54780 [Nibrella viscosa]|uniref:Uncharacterized protein n=1 Tax=Nibrella viscosa TaxID=1084524 RepID=A0ABP8L0G6_9BACT